MVWYPVQLAFVAAAIAFTMNDLNLAKSGLFTAIVILVLYYGSTFISLRGGTLFAKVGSWGGIIGTIIPGAILIVAGIVWLSIGQKAPVPLHFRAVIPPFTGLSSIVLIVSNFLAYAGMEVNAVHVNRMKDPGKDYPKVILFASMLILGVFILPTRSPWRSSCPRATSRSPRGSCTRSRSSSPTSEWDGSVRSSRVP